MIRRAWKRWAIRRQMPRLGGGVEGAGRGVEGGIGGGADAWEEAARWKGGRERVEVWKGEGGRCEEGVQRRGGVPALMQRFEKALWGACSVRSDCPANSVDCR